MPSSSLLAQKISRSLFLLALGLLLLAPAGVWLLEEAQSERSLIEQRSLAQFSNPFTGLQHIKTGIKRLLQGQFAGAYDLLLGDFPARVSGRSFQTSYESASVDQFPLRIDLILASRAAERALIALAYAPSSEAYLPSGIRGEKWVSRTQPLIVNQPARYNQNQRQQIDDRVQNLAQAIQEFPQVNFSALYVERIENSPANPLNQYFPRADSRQSLDYFKEIKPDGLAFDELLIENLADYQANFFRTDVHWKARGIWAGYEKAYRLLNSRTADLTPPLQLKGILTLEQMLFCGGLVRSSMIPCQPDVFDYPDAELPPYTTTINGKPAAFGQMKAYLAGKIPASPYALYGEFWGRGELIVGYHFESNTGRNLLLIGDSFTNSLARYLAAHFQNTYVVGLTYISTNSLASTLEQYQITDVFILGTPQVLFSRDWLFKP